MLSLFQGPAGLDDVAPSITYIIAARNVSEYIAEAVDSALKQNDVKVAVVVVDDCSTDNTAAVVEIFIADGKPVKLLRSDCNLGAAEARNVALNTVQSKWVGILDGDDIILPDRSRVLLDLAELSSADIVADRSTRFSASENVRHETLQADDEYAFHLDPASYLEANLLLKGSEQLGYVKPIFKTSLLRETNTSYDASLSIGEDFQICFDLLAGGATYVLTTGSYYLYRVREGSLSWRMNSKQVEALLKAIDTRLHTLPELVEKPQFKKSVKKYTESLKVGLLFFRVVECLKDRRWLAGVSLLARYPKIWEPFLKAALATTVRRMQSVR